MDVKTAIVVSALLAPLAAGAAADSTAPAASGQSGAEAAAPVEQQARIAFANHGGIYDWRVVDNRTVLIQSNSRQWYNATLMTSCFNLAFAERVGFETNPDGSFDKFSTIKLRGQTCPLVSLVKTDSPVKKAKKHQAPEVTTAPASPAASPPSQ
jgi:uncharacterized protein DUF6491